MAKVLHTMIRVLDLDKSIEFYNSLGMKELRRKEVPDGRYTLVFMGFGTQPEKEGEIELTYNWDRKEPYTMGDGFGHIAISCEDIHKVAEDVRKAGGKVTREPAPVKFGTTVIAFVQDPDGYKVELIERASF